ncbi:MAG: hypothetical protein KF764_13895 [Labilithrix sp.]|nr:hypothetical protein [Labilithrix sp.]MBX3224625.1 hypothetical protein [Labilithrix sp.]
MKRRAVACLLVASCATAAVGCARPAGTRARAAQQGAHRPSPVHGRALRQMCADLTPGACAKACPSTLPAREHAECLIAFRFAGDDAALELARALYAKTGVLPGVDTTQSQGTYGGTQIATRPALPIGDHRQHLAWIIASFDRYDAIFSSLAARAPRPIDFRLHPDAFVFFSTETQAYPSAWGQGGVVGYNLEGPLHTNERDVLETVFHELFHLNDERRGGWSATALGDLFEGIVHRCGTDHECFGDFAPHDTRVPDGTYYPFDEKTRDVREYAAELALRYFREHEAILEGAPLEPPFKCGSEDNRVAWERLVEDFFGGLDLSRDCALGPPSDEGP